MILKKKLMCKTIAVAKYISNHMKIHSKQGSIIDSNPGVKMVKASRMFQNE